MSFSRPLTKELLKKMFLRVLLEHQRSGERYAMRDGRIPTSMFFPSLISDKIPEFFKISKLSDNEYDTAIRAMRELEWGDYIRHHSKLLGKDIKVLTDKGRKFAEQLADRGFQNNFPSVDIDQVLTRGDLRKKTRSNYLAGEYETAIFNAFKLLEETVRSKARQPASVLGPDLMSKAFSPKTGTLKHPYAQTFAEEDAFHCLMRAAIGWFKNPSSHRTVKYNAEKAAQVLAFANLLLDMVDQCQSSSSPQKSSLNPPPPS